MDTSSVLQDPRISESSFGMCRSLLAQCYEKAGVIHCDMKVV